MLAPLRMLLEDAHAVVIGISAYQRASRLPATQDAQDVAEALRDPACGGYPPAAVRLLVDADATRAAILDALDALARDTRPGSTVFLYYSGHGAAAGGDTYFLLPVDAEGGTRDNLARTAISNRELTEKLRAIPAARITVVLDCCRAADLAEPDLSADLAPAIAPLAEGRGRAVLAASRATESSYVMPRARDSEFTGYLLEGLRGAASGVGGVIRVCDLFHYVQQRLVGAPGQHPVFRAELEENYPIARLLGGALVPLSLPEAPDVRTWDAFVSYCQDDPDDRAWVRKVLVPYLEGLGLVLCLERRDLRLGAPRLQEVERAVTRSRYTIAVLTPAYLAGPYDELEARIASHVAILGREPRFIPVMRRPCTLSLATHMTELLDLSDDAEAPAGLARLALALRQPPRARLGG